VDRLTECARSYPTITELFKFFLAIHQRGSNRPSAVMPKWGLATDMALHPTKRVKVTTRRNDVKDELIGDLASRKECIEVCNVCCIRTNLLGLEQEYGLNE
jgi:hypothetical protein